MGLTMHILFVLSVLAITIFGVLGRICVTHHVSRRWWYATGASALMALLGSSATVATAIWLIIQGA